MVERSDSGRAELTVVRDDDSSGPVLRLSGELDLSTVASVEDALAHLRETAESRPGRVAFDLSGLQFIDSSGLAVLVQCAASIGPVAVLRPSAIVRRAIEAAGLAGTLPIDP